MQEFDPHIRPYKPAESLSKEELEGMKGDPVAMYLHSLRTFSRLPEDMHESMLLHSFNSATHGTVRDYLDWVRTCEEREEKMASFRRREKIIDRLVVGSMIIAWSGFYLLLILFFKNV